MKTICMVITFFQLVLIVWISQGAFAKVPPQAEEFILLWLGMSFIFNLLSLKQFSVCFLISFFSYLVAWRILALFPQEVVIGLMTCVFFLFIYQFLHYVYLNLHHGNLYPPALSLESWQLVFMRLYIAFDFIPHFTEKLFAGPLVRAQDVLSFQMLQVPHSEIFVYLAGSIEFAAAIGLGLGIFIRLSAVLTTVYLLVATFLGKHFLAGFIWSGPHGGWEFAVLWSVLILSFAFGGGKAFSVDAYLQERWKLPKWLKNIM